jgi:hypothetical protein
MKVELGKFSRHAIEVGLGCDLADGVRTALSHYRLLLEREGRVPPPPRFLPAEPPADPRWLELAVESETEELLEREAARQDIPLQLLLGHAVQTYLAEVDRGAFSGQPLDAPTL